MSEFMLVVHGFSKFAMIFGLCMFALAGVMAYREIQEKEEDAEWRSTASKKERREYW